VLRIVLVIAADSANEREYVNFKIYCHCSYRSRPPPPPLVCIDVILVSATCVWLVQVSVLAEGKEIGLLSVVGLTF